MFFWLSMLVIVLLIPLLVLGFGVRFSKSAPRDITAVFGYKTTRSTMSWDTWTFAHAQLGKLWKLMGLIMVVVSAGLFTLVIKQGVDTVSIFTILLMLAQAIAIGVSIIFVEKSLKKNFDDRGERTEASLAEEREREEKKAAKAKKEKK